MAEERADAINSRRESADGDEPDRLLKKQLSPQAGQKHPDARRAKSRGMRRTVPYVAMIPIAIGNERNPDSCRDRWVFFNGLLVIKTGS